jgi:hypothetical protein
MKFGPLAPIFPNIKKTCHGRWIASHHDGTHKMEEGINSCRRIGSTQCQ